MSLRQSQSSLFADPLLANLSSHWNLFVTWKSDLSVLSGVPDRCRMMKNLSCLTHEFTAEAEQSDTLPSYFSSHSENKCPFHGLFSAFFFFCLFCCWFCCLKWPPSTVLKDRVVFYVHEDCDMSFGENTCIRWVLLRHELQCCWLCLLN